MLTNRYRLAISISCMVSSRYARAYISHPYHIVVAWLCHLAYGVLRGVIIADGEMSKMGGVVTVPGCCHAGRRFLPDTFFSTTTAAKLVSRLFSIHLFPRISHTLPSLNHVLETW